MPVRHHSMTVPEWLKRICIDMLSAGKNHAVKISIWQIVADRPGRVRKTNGKHYTTDAPLAALKQYLLHLGLSSHSVPEFLLIP